MISVPGSQNMVRVEIEELPDRHGMYRYNVVGMSVEGRSRSPLSDACRAIKRMGGDTSERAVAFRVGRTNPDHWCSVGWGAVHTAEDNDRGVRFGKYQAFDRSRLSNNSGLRLKASETLLGIGNLPVNQ
jgi:hypothetical protein